MNPSVHPTVMHIPCCISISSKGRVGAILFQIVKCKLFTLLYYFLNVFMYSLRSAVNCKMRKILIPLIIAPFKVVNRQVSLIAAIYQACQPLHPLIVAPFQGVWGYKANKNQGVWGYKTNKNQGVWGCKTNKNQGVWGCNANRIKCSGVIKLIKTNHETQTI